MPKFLDTPSWYGSDGKLTSDASIASGVIRVMYINTSNGEQAFVYIPTFYPEDSLTGYSNYLGYFIAKAASDKKPCYSCCTGELKNKSGKMGSAVLVTFAVNGYVTLGANVSGTVEEFTITFNPSTVSGTFNTTYLSGLNGLATLK